MSEDSETRIEDDKPLAELLPDPAETLAEAKVPFTRGAGDPAGLVTSHLLYAKSGASALLMIPKGARANFRALARRLGSGHLSLANRDDALHYGQLLGTLSPFAVFYDGARRLQPALDERLLAQPALGFPGKPGTLPIWITPEVLEVFFRALRYRLLVGDWTGQGAQALGFVSEGQTR